ncbi:LADA_0E01640g1_1 [Lachancea dasiensis]|uniref:LADA_0E01640g1_1 n=1 Tax=Lachancea dasiensis TaxID=1072105 RepID=A0A1G4JAH5_9SACH|nr:LADA_0E01640g1_1 [Lachancea dasiensis]
MRSGQSRTPASEGLVHGHMHNFNNVTYIHGHVHGSPPARKCGIIDSTNGPPHPSRQSEADAENAQLMGIPNLPISPTVSSHEENSERSELLATKEPDAKPFAASPWPFSTANTTQDPTSCAQTSGCHHFEFMNWHNLNVFGEDNHASAPDELLALSTGSKRRRLVDCDSCQPRAIEVCCQEDHEPRNTSNSDSGLFKAPNTQVPVDKMVLFQGSSLGAHALDFNTACANSKLPSFIDCDLTCAPTETTEEDRIFEKLCEQCVDLGYNESPNPSSHLHFDPHPDVSSIPVSKPPESSVHTHAACHSHSHSHSHAHIRSDSLSSQSADPEGSFNSMHTIPCHDHIVNSGPDMKILKDLVSISNMYDFPFGKHNHSHDENSDINLLQTCLPEKRPTGLRESLDTDTLLNHSHHHHHLVEVHPHPAKHIPLSADPHYSCERSSQVEYKHPMEFEKLHHSVPHQGATLSDGKTNTVNFNWIYKNDANKIECGWKQCPQVYDSLLELQSHVLKDHVIDAPSTDIKLPTPRNQFDCEWENCGFEGDDLCTLINHINGEHGIAFDMKFLDRDTLIEQSEQHHLLHCHDCPDDPESFSQVPSHEQINTAGNPCANHSNADGNIEHSHTCKWAGCGKDFSSCGELNDHIENEHIPRGKSSYVCGWESCGKTITQRQKLLRHLRVHTRYKPCKCPYCEKNFSTPDILLQHIRTHSGEKPYKCERCGKGFATSSSLRIHIRTHTGEKPLECKVCGKRFNESSNLSKHMRTHERKYKCEGCKRSFDLLEQLEVHKSRCARCRSVE